jgi:hypothetical protein
LRGNPFGKSPIEDHVEDGHFRAVRRLTCAWTDRNALLAELGADGGQLYPHDEATGARAYAANVLGYGQTSAGTASNTVAYEKALVTVYYSNEVWTATSSGGYFVSESIRPTGEVSLMPSDRIDFRWNDGSGTAVQGEQYFHEPRLVYSLTFHNVWSVPTAAATSTGTCNAASVTTYTLGLTFGAQTLRHPGPAIGITFPIGGKSRYTLKYNWIYNPHTWNKRFNPTTGTYQYIYLAGASDPVVFVPTYDFNSLRP